MVFVFLLLAVQKRLNEILELLKTPRYIWLLLVTSILLGLNWFVYIYAVNTDRVIEASLGYYINPLFNVLMGFLFLRERLNVLQSLALGLAALGVLIYLWDFGSLPWIALMLAVTFALYGLVRKIITVKPLVGLFIEAVLLSPLAVLLIGFWQVDGSANFGNQWDTDLLLLGAGVVTSLPLLWFVNAAKRLRYSTMGLFQYFSPSLSLVLGVFFFNETFTQTHLITFSLIWSGLAIFSINTLKVQSVCISVLF